jgi:F-type H+-transporting ATPase subunit b
MKDLLANFGVDWKLLFSQVVNFLLIFFVLKITVYKPLLSILAERKKKIEIGLEKAVEADKRLSEISEIKVLKVKEAQKEAAEIIREAGIKGKEEEEKIMGQALKKEKEIEERGKERVEAERADVFRRMEKEAIHLVKSILVKTVSLSPEQIDETLIERAAREVKEPAKR